MYDRAAQRPWPVTNDADFDADYDAVQTMGFVAVAFEIANVVAAEALAVANALKIYFVLVNVISAY